MLNPFTHDTLRLRIPFGKTLLLALVFLIAGIGVSEVTARVIAAQNVTFVPSVASPHRQFEITLARLEQFAQRGPVDCIALGSSVVYRGINPDAVSQAFAEKNGQPLRCFNFGVQGLTASTAGKLARILAQDYHPALLIYGTTAHDYTAASGTSAANALDASPWFAYRSGEFSPEGWLIENSYALRAYVVQRDWMKPSYAKYLRYTRKNEAAILANGFNPRRGTRISGDNFLHGHQATRLERVYGEFALDTQELQGLDEILSLNASDTQVLIVEMPIHTRLLEFFPHGARDVETFRAKVGNASAARQIPFWSGLSAESIPASAWFDTGHLNAQGADLYSRWLGNAVGNAVANGSMPALSHVTSTR